MVNFKKSLTLRSGVKLRNRLVMAPMTVILSFHDGTVTKEEIKHYKKRAAGFGMVITAAANVTDSGKGWLGELTIANNGAIPQLRKLAKAIQSQGAKAVLQIFHAGRMASSRIIGEQVLSASDVAAEVEGAELPRGLSDAEILDIVEAFGQATRRAIAAGFDGVEIHGANMYLIHQFFSPHSNRRTDRWGGSIEKRAAFPLAVVDRVLSEVRETTKRPFIVGYRFSPVEATTPGIQLGDTFYLLEQLKQKPLDYLHVSLKDYSRKSNSPDFQEKSELAYLHDVLAGEIPLIGVGAVRTRSGVEAVLEAAELCAIGEQVLVEPDFAVKLLEGRDALVTKPFGEAIKDLPMPHPMFKYLEKRYK